MRKLALGVDWSPEGVKLVALSRRFRRLRVLGWLQVSAPLTQDSTAKVEEFLKRNRLGEARVIACLPREGFLIRFLDLPLEAESQLARVIGYQVDALHPFQDTPICWESAVVARDVKARQIRVMIAIAEQSVLDRQCQALKDLGLHVDSLTFEVAPLAGLVKSLLPEMALVAVGRGSKVELLAFRQGSLVAARELSADEGGAPQRFERELHALGSVLPPGASNTIPTFICGQIPSAFLEILGESQALPLPAVDSSAARQFDSDTMLPALAAAHAGVRRKPSPALNFLPSDARKRPRRWSEAPFYALGASAALLGLVLLAHGAIERAVYGVSLARETKRLSAQAEAARRHSELADRLTERAALLEGLRTGTWKKLEILRELTRLLPDGTWVQDLQVGQETVEFSGYSSRAAELIQPLENSPYFSHVEFASPITRGTDNKEVFRIRLRVRKPGVH